jgi:putative hydrolase of the HAD superfamily
MKIEAIFFDMGGTIDLYPMSETAVADSCIKMKRMLEAAGASQLSGMSGNEFINIVLSGIKRYKSWRKDTELPPEKVFGDFVLAETGVPKPIIHSRAEDLAFLVDAGFYQRSPRPEAGQVLRAIKDRGLRAGIISNVISRSQVDYSLDQYGLTEYFDTIVLSSVFGKRKPHPDIFHEAFQKAGLHPAHLIFVGNSPAKDIAGAKNAGVGKTVYIEYQETPAAEMGSAVADYHIKDLRELIGIIDGLNHPLTI